MRGSQEWGARQLSRGRKILSNCDSGTAIIPRAEDRRGAWSRLQKQPGLWQRRPLQGPPRGRLPAPPFPRLPESHLYLLWPSPRRAGAGIGLPRHAPCHLAEQREGSSPGLRPFLLGLRWPRQDSGRALARPAAPCARAPE